MTQNRSPLSDYLPSREICAHLLAHYWNAVHPIATTVHRPSFEKQCASFWGYLSSGTEPPPSLQAIYFSAIFSAAVSMPEKLVLDSYAIPKPTLIERLQTAVETSLSRANFLRTAKLETMQAFVMYLVSGTSAARATTFELTIVDTSMQGRDFSITRSTGRYSDQTCRVSRTASRWCPLRFLHG